LNIKTTAAVAGSNVLFFNITVNELAIIVSSCIAVIYAGIGILEARMKWQRHKAELRGIKLDNDKKDRKH